jgi:hydroxyacylglutathione hydrolase
MVIDPSAFYNEEKLFLLNFINKLGGNLKFIVNTHGHFDHIASNDFLKSNFPDAKLLIHFADSEKLTSPLKNRSAEFSLNVTSRQADKLLKESDRIVVGNASFVVIHTPGHTKGSISLFGEDMLFSGDTLFAGMVGTAKEYKNAYNEMIRSIKEKLLILPDKTVILPGHMEVSTIGEEKSLNPFIQ